MRGLARIGKQEIRRRRNIEIVRLGDCEIRWLGEWVIA